MEGLSFDNILGEQDIDNLFVDPEEEKPSGETEGAVVQEGAIGERHSDTSDKTTEAVDPEALFEEEEKAKEEKQPESVGSEEKKEKEQEDAATVEDDGTSPQENFYSSIANALAVDGIFPNLDEESVRKVQDAEGLSELIDAEVNARLDEKQQKIAKALESGVEPTDIRKYESTLQYISSITDEALSEEGEKGEQLRKSIIFQDYLNKGYSRERAEKMTMRSIDSGNDIEDAKEALQGNRDYFQKEYDKLLADAQKVADKEKARSKRQGEELRQGLLEDKYLAGGLEVSKAIRKKAFDCISKPVYKDPDTGDYLTALQKYEAEHRVDFLKYVGLFMAMTDGFKDFKSFMQPEVKKEVKKGLKELEQRLRDDKRTTGGSLKMVTSVSEDPESYYSKGFRLDL